MRRPGELGIHSLDHFHFVVPDVKGAELLLRVRPCGIREAATGLALGLQVAARLGYDRRGARARSTSTCPSAPSKTISTASPSACRRWGSAALDPPAGVDSNGLWFHDHDGNLVEIAVTPKTSPNEKSVFAAASVGAGGTRRAVPQHDQAHLSAPLRAYPHVHPRRPKAIEFYTRVLGLRLSDHSGDNIAFLHGIHGSDHHMVAFARSNAPGHHHFSWDVGSVDEIGAGAMHMLDKGYDRAGVSAGTCSARIISTMCGIPGAATANIPPTSTMCRPIATGMRATIRRKIPSTPGDRTCPRTSCTITKPDFPLNRLRGVYQKYHAIAGKVTGL